MSNNYCFVDGSYNKETKTYGYGGFLVSNGTEHIIQGSGADPKYSKMWNIAGEIMGSIAAIDKAIELGLGSITIYYDYLGIEKWAKGEWKRNHPATIEYHRYYNSIKDKINVKFIKVKSHSGIKGNERADILAKEAVGII